MKSDHEIDHQQLKKSCDFFLLPITVLHEDRMVEDRHYIIKDRHVWPTALFNAVSQQQQGICVKRWDGSIN